MPATVRLLPAPRGRRGVRLRVGTRLRVVARGGGGQVAGRQGLIPVYFWAQPEPLCQIVTETSQRIPQIVLKLS